jgi:HSP20 family protein
MFGTRWTPFNNPVWHQLHQLQHEVNRVFDRLGEHDRPFAGGDFPPLSLWEEDDAFFLEAELPGLKLDEIEIFVTGHNQLTIKGERKAPALDKGVQHRQERGFGQFTRTLVLPMDVNAEGVDARLEHGILKIRLPKSEAAKPHKIEIKS